MRFQTTFEKIVQGTSQQAFAMCFVLLRIAGGLAILYIAFALFHAPVNSTAPVGSPSYEMQTSDLHAVQILLGPVLVVIGLMFVVGLLVRPIAIVAIAFLLLNAATSGSIEPERMWLTNGLVSLVLLLFAAGGSGHALGLDGIISRNIRRPNPLTKFLFG